MEIIYGEMMEELEDFTEMEFDAFYPIVNINLA